MREFPSDFLWGTATSAYQIEGSLFADGRTPCIWDHFASMPGNIRNGDTAERTSDSYVRWQDDLDLLEKLGVGAYRFSIAWPRIFPRRGKLNEAGLAFYDRIIGELRARSIVPVVTMNHWDLPLWAFEQGGWENRESVSWFLEYADTLLEAFGPRVPLWITHNEPFCVAMLGYMKGIHAPGVKDIYRGMRVAHHLLLSHGKAVRLFREKAIPGAGIGITVNLSPGYPADPENGNDRLMAIRADGFVNRWFLDPLFRASYPSDMVEVFEQRSRPIDFIERGDMETIATPCDFLGVNYYRRNLVRTTSEGLIGYLGVDEPNPKTGEEWQKVPPYFTDLLFRLRDEYTGDLPLYITENGLGQTVEETGTQGSENAGMLFTRVSSSELRDSERIAYVNHHIRQCADFISVGGNLKGYFLWSLLDNFEWALGYSMRFGLVHVDYASGARTLKDSARFYAALIREQAGAAGHRMENRHETAES